MYRALSPQPRPELEEEELDSAEPVEQRTLGSLVRALEERTGPLLALALAVLGLVLAAPASASEPGVAEATRAAHRLELDLKRPPCRVGVVCAAVLDVYGDVNVISRAVVARAHRRPCAHPIDQRRALRVEHARHLAFAEAATIWGLNPRGRTAAVLAVDRYLLAAGRLLTAC